MQNGLQGGRQLLLPPTDSDRRGRATYVRRIGTQVRNGTYEPPLDGVVESLVSALLPHVQGR